MPICNPSFLEQALIKWKLSERGLMLELSTHYRIPKNRDPYLQVTWADVITTELLAALQSVVPQISDRHEPVKAWVDRVRSLPRIKKWIDERPKTSF